MLPKNIDERLMSKILIQLHQAASEMSSMGSKEQFISSLPLLPVLTFGVPRLLMSKNENITKKNGWISSYWKRG